MKPAGPLTSPDVVNNGAFLSAGTSPSIVIAEHDYSSCRVAGDSTAGTHQAMRFRNSARVSNIQIPLFNFQMNK